MMSPAALTRSFCSSSRTVLPVVRQCAECRNSYTHGDKWVPNKSHATGSGNEFNVGPHIMIIGPDQKVMRTLNQNGSNGEPYVNHLPGHPELFLVIPIREWDDAQAVRTVGAVRR